MKKILVLNGPNLNLLGTREPAQYGHETLADVERLCAAAGGRLGIGIECRQSNHEGVLIDWIHESGREVAAGRLLGVVFNAGAYTHSYISPVARGIIVGFGVKGYALAIDALARLDEQ
jgi:3-dehydroquinate dehydratase-2